MPQLKDRVAAITGAGSGIGRAIAETFADRGAAIAVIDRDLTAAQATVDSIRDNNGKAQAFRADISIESQVKAAYDEIIHAFSAVDILVNNAAISRGDDILTIDRETWVSNLDVVLRSIFFCSKTILPQMISAGRGVIVNIGSVNGLMAIGEEPYSAAKAGVINLTQNMALRYARHGIRVNVICPGTVETPGWSQHLQKDPQILERLSKWYPLGRVGKPQDIANAALFLASDDAAWITGAVIPVDGGLTAGNYGMFREIRDNT